MKDTKKAEDYLEDVDIKDVLINLSQKKNVWRKRLLSQILTDFVAHSQGNRDGKSQPKMKQSSIDREKTRGKDGILKSKN